MYMECLNEFVERELPNMKNFLDLISVCFDLIHFSLLYSPCVKFISSGPY